MAAFVGVLVLMAAWEAAAPRRVRAHPRLLRWSGNLGVVAIDTLLVRLVFPVVAVGLALRAEEEGWGLLNVVGAPAWFAFAASLLVLDLAIYLQHVMVHAVPALWRLHRMHHADLDFDATTGVRFHPLEILLSMGLKLAVVAALGPPAAAVLVFEVLLNATSLFNHGNVRLPAGLDRALRLVVVTPDMHRVHHSIHPAETNSNFGFNLPWWDRLLGTYRAQPREGHEAMTIGIEQFRDRRDLGLDRMLMQPFRGPASGYPINREEAAAEPGWTEVGELGRLIASASPPVVLDVRGVDEFEGPLGHIRGALNIPVAELGGRLGEVRAAGDAPIAIVCRTDKRSAAAAKTLRGAGFRRVSVLRGGMERWNAEGLPVARGETSKGAGR
jgi:sterol desaturase/sphingolipid hydroxylase (fatty acid hydroxylase superfamily)/rhodanese-related sulfurtransferase